LKLALQVVNDCFHGCILIPDLGSTQAHGWDLTSGRLI
jgi:hypothetical protein